MQYDQIHLRLAADLVGRQRISMCLDPLRGFAEYNFFTIKNILAEWKVNVELHLVDQRGSPL